MRFKVETQGETQGETKGETQGETQGETWGEIQVFCLMRRIKTFRACATEWNRASSFWPTPTPTPTPTSASPAAALTWRRPPSRSAEDSRCAGADAAADAADDDDADAEKSILGNYSSKSIFTIKFLVNDRLPRTLDNQLNPMESESNRINLMKSRVIQPYSQKKTIENPRKLT